ncbi:MAG: hypothetical protein EBX52_10520 [Proteobacteria bacterium]|nr:hypothetical protein [Pseudomonadota bacterium]
METQPSNPTIFSAFGAKQFGTAQLILLIVLILLLLRFLKRSTPESHFRTDAFQRPSPRPDRTKREQQEKREQMRTLLGGFAFTGQPHEVLGVRKEASELEIRRAHRELIKRFHPDKVGPQGSKEWYEAQKIAETINNARDEMLKTLAGRK